MSLPHSTSGKSHFLPLVASYSTAHFGKTLIWSFFNTFFLFFAVFALDLSPLLAGSILLLFALIDALSDVPAAFLIARYSERFGGMRQWVAFSAPITGIFLILCFSLLSYDETAIILAVSVGAGIVFRVAFTFIDVPLNSSIGLLVLDNRKRNFVAGGRSLAGSAANVFLAVLTALVIERDGQIAPDRLWGAAMLIAILGPLLVIPSFSHIDKRAVRLGDLSVPGTAIENYRFMKAGLTRGIVVLTAVNIAYILLASQFSRSLIFLVDGAANENTTYSEVWMVMTIGSALTVWIWVWVASKFNKRNAAIVSLFMVAIAVAMFPLTVNSPMLLLGVAIFLSAVFHVNTIIWSILPDAVDEMSARVGALMHVPAIGVFSAIGKVTIGFSQFLGGILLEISGYPDRPDRALFESLSVGTTLAGCAITILLLLGVSMARSTDSTLMSRT